MPSSPGLVAPRAVIERVVEAGGTALFHVGNHGDNSWKLIELSVISEGPCPAEADGA